MVKNMKWRPKTNHRSFSGETSELAYTQDDRMVLFSFDLFES